jgi:UDP:flavonoid glycosyltransferase YjiC (YdhE family)
MILLTTTGSLGDLHPYLALGTGLQNRGHRVAVGTCEAYRGRVEALGLEFRPIGPHISPDDPEVIKLVIDPKNGPENIFRKLIMPYVRASYDDTARAVEGATLVVGHPLMLSVPLLAERKKIPWASIVLAPISFFSAYDPIEIPGHPIASAMTRGPQWLRTLVRSMGRAQTRSWVRPFLEFRRELGVANDAHPLFEGQHSPHLALALYTEMLADPKPDWPKSAKVTGFCFHDRNESNAGLSPGLTEFLASGPPPIVFTLGSTAVRNPGTFYEESVAAAKALGKRAVILGSAPAAPDVWVEPYAPYSLLFPKCEAVVCSGGIGTVGQALRSGTPFLIVPHGNDQPDNAVRCARLGGCRHLSRDGYRRDRAAEELRALLGDPQIRTKAKECARMIGQEDGVAAACDALEKLLGSQSSIT